MSWWLLDRLIFLCSLQSNFKRCKWLQLIFLLVHCNVIFIIISWILASLAWLACGDIRRMNFKVECARMGGKSWCCMSRKTILSSAENIWELWNLSGHSCCLPVLVHMNRLEKIEGAFFQGIDEEAHGTLIDRAVWISALENFVKLQDSISSITTVLTPVSELR